MPKDVKRFQEREERRIFGLPIILSLGEEGIELPARLNNISEGGISFKSNAHFPDGELINVLIPYPKQIISHEEHEPVRLRVEVRWSKEFTDSEDVLVRYIHGCRFVFSDNASRSAEYVKTLMELSKKLGEKPLGF